jgi:uroporphyrin-III C-methyltransferase/precorrin-2 dehydrogenase/sirohydrochlorin ferrochelatase
MDHLPIFIDLKGKRTLVAGSGAVAARKADLLLRAGMMNWPASPKTMTSSTNQPR